MDNGLQKNNILCICLTNRYSKYAYARFNLYLYHILLKKICFYSLFYIYLLF